MEWWVLIMIEPSYCLMPPTYIFYLYSIGFIVYKYYYGVIFTRLNNFIFLQHCIVRFKGMLLGFSQT